MNTRPRSLRAIEQPEQIGQLLATWVAAFEGPGIAARSRPRMRPAAVGKAGHTLWRASVAGLDVSISLEEVRHDRWRLDHNSQGALAEMDGKPVLLRQWYVKRAPQDASLSAAEIAAITEEQPYYVAAGIPRNRPNELRLYQVFADLSAPAEAIRDQTAAAVTLQKAASDKFGNG